jgi:hypothetical protein
MGSCVKAPTFLVSALAMFAMFVAAGAVQSQVTQAAAARPAISASAARQRAQAFLARRGVGRRGTAIPAAVLLQARAQHAALVRTQIQAQSLTQIQVQSQSSPPTVWQPVGPMQVSTSAWGLVTGRVTSLAADPSDTSGNTLYVGTTGGGVWKSTTAAQANPTFLPLTDDLSAYSSASLTSLSIGAMSVQPGGTGVVLAGTGDPNDATDSWYGAGILRSTDGGATWTLITYALGPGNLGKSFSFAGNAIAEFAWSTTNPNEVVAAVSQSAYGALLGTAGSHTISVLGLYDSQDAGATWSLATIEDGTTFVENPAAEQTGSNAVTAVVWNPIRKSFYAAVRSHGYYASTDGVTWTRLANQPGANLTTAMCPANSYLPASPACPIFRGALAVQPATGDMFALTVDGNNLDQGLWQDVCSLTSGVCASPAVAFGKQIADQPLDSGNGTISAGDYNLWLAAAPAQQDTLLFAGTTDIYKCSLANSCVWRNTTNTQTCAAAQVAPAQHAAESTLAASGLMYFGNDGGLWRSADAVNQKALACSTDDAAHFQNLNGGLGSLAEVESFSEDPSNANTWMAALGALGTAAPEGNAQVWNQVLDGESNGVAIDPVNPQNWYATSEFGVGINQCTAGASCDGAGFGSVAIGEAQVENDVQTIPAPWLLDPVNTADVILGTCRVWRGSANGAGWGGNSLLSVILDGDRNSSFCNGNAEIRALAAGVDLAGNSGDGEEQIYAGMSGVLDGGGLAPGHVFTAAANADSEAPTTAWTDEYASPVTNDTNAQFNPGEFDISSIYADPHDVTGQTVYVTVQGYSSALLEEPLVYRSTDAGVHWADITANLPNAPANSIVVDPNDANTVYVATDTGVYITQNVSSCSSGTSDCWNVFGSGLPNAPVIALMTIFQDTTQALRAATYGRGIWEVQLATGGITLTSGDMVPSSLSFSPQQVQTAGAAQPITVTNTGRVNLNVSSIAMAGDFSETDTCVGQSIPPSGTCGIQVSFNPTQTGAEQGMLTLDANVSGGEVTALLTGTGLAPAAVALDPGSLTFGAVNVGDQSAGQTISIINTGGEPATLSAETVSGDYAIAGNSCSGTLDADSSCTLSIVFAPAGSGTRGGTLTVTDSLGTQTAQLTGTGESAATDSLGPPSLVFAAQQVETASAAQTVTLSNDGDQTLTDIAVAVSGDFSAASKCGLTLQGHGSCSIEVTYAPRQIGTEAGTLTVSDEFRTQTVNLSGTGLAPPGASSEPGSIDFGGFAAGTTSSVQTVTVTNLGGIPLTNLTAAITANFAVASNNCTATLAVGAACRIGVTFTAPATAGSATGSLTISAANLPQTMTVQLSGATQDFSMTVSGSTSAVIVSGQTASFTAQLGGLGGMTGTVKLTCSGAPQYATCTFGDANNGACPAGATATVTLNGENASTADICVATGVAPSSAMSRNPTAGGSLVGPVLALFLPLALVGTRRKRWAGLLVVLAAVLLAPTGCSVAASSGSGGGGGGGGTTPQNTTPSGAYVLTVTGTTSDITHSVGVNLTVE